MEARLVRVLVLGAGGPAGVNTCRALVAAGHDVFGVDANPDHWSWITAAGARVASEPHEFAVDVVVPQPDSLVRETATIDLERGSEPGAYTTLLPSLEVIDSCQAKGIAGAVWHAAGLRGPVCRVTEPWPDLLHLAADELGLPFWLRAEHGAGANKAIKVTEVGEGFHWIRFWQSRGVEVSWIAEQYLPGRDLAWTGIYRDGELFGCFLRERLEYLYPHLSPEGLTGTPTVARIVSGHDGQTLVQTRAMQAVEAVDDRPNGIYSVDLREDEHGVARPTEINAGRGFTTLGLWSLFDPAANLLDMVVRLAAGEDVDKQFDPFPEGLTLSRHIDCGHVFTNAAVYA